MEQIVNLYIEKLPEGMCLATSDAIQGLVAQWRTIQETIDIARNVAKKLLKQNRDVKEALRFPLLPIANKLKPPQFDPNFPTLITS